MILEGLFVYFPTIIAITLAFFVGLGIGCFIVGGLCIGAGLAIWKVSSLRTIVLSWLEEENINKCTKK